MDAGLSFQPGTSNTGGSPSSALTPLQSAVQVLSLNLPTAAARQVSPLASNGPAARSFNPETLVAQTLLRSLTGSGMPNQVLMDHLNALLSGFGQTAPSLAPPPPTVTFGTGKPGTAAPPPPPVTMNGSGDAASQNASPAGRVA